jgi:hypothetical protein
MGGYVIPFWKTEASQEVKRILMALHLGPPSRVSSWVGQHYDLDLDGIRYFRGMGRCLGALREELVLEGHPDAEVHLDFPLGILVVTGLTDIVYDIIFCNSVLPLLQVGTYHGSDRDETGVSDHHVNFRIALMHYDDAACRRGALRLLR